MSVATGDHLVVVINPAASFGKNSGVGDQVLALLREAGYEADGVRAANYAALQAATKQAIRPTTRALVIVGGDGMVHLAVELCGEYSLPLGVIPTGTGNDLARHLGIPLGDVASAVADLVEGFAKVPIAIDRGVAKDSAGVSHPFACVLSAGFDAIVTERANRLRFPKGRHRYTIALLIELAQLRPRRYVLTIDGVEETGSYLLVAVANSQSFGGGMKVTPAASLQDGKLDVFTLAPLSRLAFLRIYPRVFRGLHVSDHRVSIRQASTVRVECEGVVAFADGEVVSALPIDVSVERGRLHVFAPRFGQPA